LAIFLKGFPIVLTQGRVDSILVLCLKLVAILKRLISSKLVTIATLEALKNSERAAIIVLRVLMLATIDSLIKVVASKESAFMESTSSSKQECSTILMEGISSYPRFKAIGILEQASIYSETLTSISHLQPELTSCIIFTGPRNLDCPMMADIVEWDYNYLSQEALTNLKLCHIRKVLKINLEILADLGI
jgi:hypothetical protein